MRNGAAGFVVCSVLVFSCTCKSANSISVTYPTTGEVEGPVLETVTMNWGLAPGVITFATPRIAAVAKEVEKLRGSGNGGVGIACFQELWTQESKDAVISALGPNMYHYEISTRGDNQRDGVDVCSPNNIKKVAACAREKCGDLPAEEQSICVRKNCEGELTMAYIYGSHKCVYCLVASVGKSIEDTVRNCTQFPDGPKIAGVSRAYDGQNGVMLISRWPLQNQEALRLRASFSNRVALFATVEIDGFGPIEVACSHISTYVEDSIPPNHPDFSSWDEEMNAQVDEISRKQRKRAGNNPSLFLVDLNAGPALDKGDIKGTMYRVWSHARRLGYFSPATRADKPFCTMCEDNTLRLDTENTIIDHVFVRDQPGGVDLLPVLVHPIFDEEVVYDSYGIRRKTHLSDHYGTVVKFKLFKE